MRQFFWKIVLCVLPVALALWVTIAAVNKYRSGEPGGFKLGVDLVGGTILVYEIDLRKQQEDEGENKFDPVRDINVLAESLKRRIDPNDLYNIVIRPAGGEGRVEIILPTGGIHRTKKAEEAWNELLQQISAKYELKETVEVGRGRIIELADKIQTVTSREIWEKKLFNDPKAWEQLKKAAQDKWAELDPNLKDNPNREAVKKRFAELDQVKQDRLKAFSAAVYELLLPTEVNASEASIESWVKQRAWEEMLERARAKWPFLEKFKAEMERIPADNVEELVSFIQAKGVVINQAAIAALEPILGPSAFKLEYEVKKDDGKDDGKDKKGGEAELKEDDVKSITDFVTENYGPSAHAISQDIAKLAGSGGTRDLALEDVQRIKDLVAKVGSLEFRILANYTDDKIGIDDAKNLINEGLLIAEDLEKRAKAGLPPPPPKNQEFWPITLPRGVTSKLTYSWVEMGPQERKQLNLDNAARNDADRNYVWLEAQRNKNKATLLHDRTGRELLQGALFYTRECKDTNLPEEERRQKEFEYFVLTRDPEIDPDDPTNKKRLPKIDGSYLVSAVSSPGQDFRPAVHFVFNNAGGDLFGDITRKNVPSGAGAEADQIRRHLAIILDGLVMSAPTINSEIRTHGQISGSFTAKEVDALVNILRAGRLPATLKPQPVSESTMGPTLGQDTIQAGVTAIFWAFFGVLAFMIVYYRFAGIVASIALLANLILMVGFMVAVQATFTLPGLAGIVLTLGIAVDANVLIYERLREERERGCTLIQALRNGYDRALPTIIDTHLASIFTAVVLYIVGNDQLKGFGVSLTVGLIVSLFTSLYITRMIFNVWQHAGWLKKLSMMRLFARPQIDFMGIRKPMFAITVALALLGIVLFIARLPDDLNIDFRGGTAYGGQMVQPKSIEELRKMLDEGGPLNVKAEAVDNLRYNLHYENAAPRTVVLANQPLGETPEARAETVAARASQLPDTSVELYYPSFKEAEGDRSYFFNVRSSEKEPEIVQAVLDQRLRTDDGKPLMKKVYMSAEPAATKTYRLSFWADPEKTTAEAGSVTFIKSLFQRELFRTFGVSEKKDLPFQYDIVGEGRTTADGRNEVMVLKLETAPTESQRSKIEQVLATTQSEFAARPQPDRLENFDSQLATETRFRAMWAVLASWGAILLYLWFRFGSWTFGLAAVICLVHDLFITMGLIAAAHYVHGTFLGNILGLEDFKLDLPSVAALLTLVGYSVNDTIVVFDRIREVRGKNPLLTPQMINDSVNQTLSRTVLASLTTWIVVVILYIFGGPGVKLFAFVMVVGVIVGTYSSIYISAPLLLLFREGVHEESSAPSRELEAAAARA